MSEVLKAYAPKALVLFGSASDGPVVEPLLDELVEAGFATQLEYVSAHRDPARLDQILGDTQFDLLVAGAGLAAHLPGVAASKTQRPVIGVPVGVAFSGLDALMSIVQMPPGIPVLTAPLPTPKNSTKIWREIFDRWMALDPLSPRFQDHAVHFVCGSAADEKAARAEIAKKAGPILAYAAIKWTSGRKPVEGIINVIVAPEGKIPRTVKLTKKHFAFFLPFYKSARLAKPEAAVTLAKNIMKNRPHGLWVGANNFVNAACASIELCNRDGRYGHVLELVKKGKFRA